MTRFHKTTLTFLFRLLPLLLVVAAWEIAATRSDRTQFLFGRPSSVVQIFSRRLVDGTLFVDLWTTLQETLIGFILGNVIGIMFGLLLWRYATIDRLVRPYLIAFGAVPIFALAPVLVVWFGTGLLSKVVLVFLSTVVIATLHAHTGATEIEPDHLRLFRSWQASEAAIFRLLVLPSALTWVLAGLRLNIGFAILGAFIGEFISSERGLAHQILIDAGLYNISGVWSGIIAFAAMALMLYSVIRYWEHRLIPWRPSQNPWASPPISPARR